MEPVKEEDEASEDDQLLSNDVTESTDRFISFHFVSFRFISFHFVLFHFISFHFFIHVFQRIHLILNWSINWYWNWNRNCTVHEDGTPLKRHWRVQLLGDFNSNCFFCVSSLDSRWLEFELRLGIDIDWCWKIAGLSWMADAMELMLLAFVTPTVGCLWTLTPVAEATIVSCVFLGQLISRSITPLCYCQIDIRILLLSCTLIILYRAYHAWS